MAVRVERIKLGSQGLGCMGMSAFYGPPKLNKTWSLLSTMPSTVASPSSTPPIATAPSPTKSSSERYYIRQKIIMFGWTKILCFWSMRGDFLLPMQIHHKYFALTLKKEQIMRIWFHVYIPLFFILILIVSSRLGLLIK